MLVVRNDLPVKNLDQLVSYLKTHPETWYGSAGTASAGHVNSVQLSIARQLATTHIAFDIVNNSPEAFTARVRKDSDVMADLVKRKVIVSE